MQLLQALFDRTADHQLDGQALIDLERQQTVKHGFDYFIGVFDIDRGARNHIAFGYGAHQCLGQNLARVELQVVFDTLFKRVPTLRVDVPMAELAFKDDATVYGLHRLPVSW